MTEARHSVNIETGGFKGSARGWGVIALVVMTIALTIGSRLRLSRAARP